jgi:hypothetical protein
MKYRFGTREWAAAANGVFAQRALYLAAKGVTEQVSLCEIYRNMPPEFGWEGNQLAWSCVYGNGEADFQLRERDDVDFKVAGNYPAFTELATYVIGGDPEREAAYYKLAIAKAKAGDIEILIGTGFKEPGNLESVHDVLARMTE